MCSEAAEEPSALPHPTEGRRPRLCLSSSPMTASVAASITSTASRTLPTTAPGLLAPRCRSILPSSGAPPSPRAAPPTGFAPTLVTARRPSGSTCSRTRRGSGTTSTAVTPSRSSRSATSCPLPPSSPPSPTCESAARRAAPKRTAAAPRRPLPHREGYLLRRQPRRPRPPRHIRALSPSAPMPVPSPPWPQPSPPSRILRTPTSSRRGRTWSSLTWSRGWCVSSTPRRGQRSKEPLPTALGGPPERRRTRRQGRQRRRMRRT